MGYYRAIIVGPIASQDPLFLIVVSTLPTLPYSVATCVVVVAALQSTMYVRMSDVDLRSPAAWGWGDGRVSEENPPKAQVVEK